MTGSTGSETSSVELPMIRIHPSSVLTSVYGRPNCGEAVVDPSVKYSSNSSGGRVVVVVDVEVEEVLVDVELDVVVEVEEVLVVSALVVFGAAVVVVPSAKVTSGPVEVVAAVTSPSPPNQPRPKPAATRAIAAPAAYIPQAGKPLGAGGGGGGGGGVVVMGGGYRTSEGRHEVGVTPHSCSRNQSESDPRDPSPSSQALENLKVS